MPMELNSLPPEDYKRVFNRIYWMIYGERGMDAGTFQAPMSKEDKEGSWLEQYMMQQEENAVSVKKNSAELTSHSGLSVRHIVP